jgi:membrane protease YdiL (CAAX protease family)
MAEQSAFAEKLRGFGPVGLAAMLVIIVAALLFGPIAAILVIGWAKWARVPWPEIGFGRPKSWALTILGGIVAGVVLKLVLKAVVMPLLAAPPANAAFAFATGNPAALARMIATVVIVAGLGEEILYRGYLFERLRRLLGRSGTATAAVVIITTALFAAAHLADQGVPGAEQAAITGLTFAGLYLLSGSLWLSIVTHASFDITALLMIYFGVEGVMARSIWG